MIYYIEEFFLNKNLDKTAGNKARKDISFVFNSLGYSKLSITLKTKNKTSLFNKIIVQYDLYKEWKTAIETLVRGDVIVIQLPIANHFIFISHILKIIKEKGVSIIAFIHDLETLRFNKDSTNIKRLIRNYAEETACFKYYDVIISHNKNMTKVLNEKYGNLKIVNLDIFDYLTNEAFSTNRNKRIVIAGRLSRFKSSYIYEIPENITLNLYGIDYDETVYKANHKYFGSFSSEELPKHLKGKYGLVWDGDSIDSCTGNTGEYLRFNNPHKASLYLASGIPLLVWKESAMAEYVVKNKCGVVISTISSITEITKQIDDIEYEKMKANAIKIGKRLRRGFYTKRAMKKALSEL